MALTNTVDRYGRVAQFFHWATAALILIMLPLGVFMTWLPAETGDHVTRKVFYYSLHKTIGVTVLAIAILRIGWALMSARPAPLHPERRLETFAAETVHWLLYAGIILAPVTGLLHNAASTGFAPIWWPFGQDLPFVPKDEQLSKILGYAHWATVIVIGLSIAAHIGGALKHAIIDRDMTLTRMVAGDAVEIRAPAAGHSGHGLSALAAFVVLVCAVGAASLYASRDGGPAIAAGQDSAQQATNAAERAGGWIVNHTQSTLKIAITQLGSPVDGQFATWQADIVFDPDALDEARVDVTIDIASLTVGTVSEQAVSAEFLNAAEHPQARFTAETFRQTGDGRYEADGTLTLHGVEQALVLPFDLSIEGDSAQMSAETAINRMDFGVGAKGYANEDSVGFEVKVIIDLAATRAGSDEAPSG